MPKRSKIALCKTTVDQLVAAEKELVCWDRDLPGFGIRVYPSGNKVYVAQSRGPAGIKRTRIGRHGDITAEQARKEAVAVINRIKRGEDPLPEEDRPKRILTVAELAERYMEAHVGVHCNAHTQGIYEGSLRNHILPALGPMPVPSVDREHVVALHFDLRETPRAANRALMVLSKMYALAEAWGLAPPNGNPCRYVLRYKEGRRERFLEQDEYRRLGLALRDLRAEGPAKARAAAALLLLMLTGCRHGEVLTLRWSDVDRKSGEIRLRDAKTGARMVPLSPAALHVLKGVKRVGGSSWVFTGKTPKRHLADLRPYWHRVREQAEVKDIRIHDLRHSFASRALKEGLALPMIGRLLGHTDVGSTARYAHLSQEAEKVAADRVGGSIDGSTASPPGSADGEDADDPPPAAAA